MKTVMMVIAAIAVIWRAQNFASSSYKNTETIIKICDYFKSWRRTTDPNISTAKIVVEITWWNEPGMNHSTLQNIYHQFIVDVMIHILFFALFAVVWPLFNFECILHSYRALFFFCVITSISFIKVNFAVQKATILWCFAYNYGDDVVCNPLNTPTKYTYINSNNSAIVVKLYCRSLSWAPFLFNDILYFRRNKFSTSNDDWIFRNEVIKCHLKCIHAKQKSVCCCIFVFNLSITLWKWNEISTTSNQLRRVEI